jgi:hypothetical protein
VCISKKNVPFCVVRDSPSFFRQFLEQLISAHAVLEHPFSLAAGNISVVNPVLDCLREFLFNVFCIACQDVFENNVARVLISQVFDFKLVDDELEITRGETKDSHSLLSLEGSSGC